MPTTETHQPPLVARYHRACRLLGSSAAVDKISAELIASSPDWHAQVHALQHYLQETLVPGVPLPLASAPVQLDDWQSLAALPKREVLIDGALRAGEVMLLVGAAKTRKTWIALDLAMSACEGSQWLGMFGFARECNTVYIDAECPADVLGERLQMLRFNSPKMRAALAVHSARGRLPRTVEAACERVAQAIAQHDADLCIIDTLSAFVPITDENDNAEATRVMGQIIAVADQMHCALCIVHHTPKGGAAGRSVVDAAAGAGAYTRRVDTVAAVREQDSETYMELRCRSLPPVERLALSTIQYSWRTRAEWAPEELDAEEKKSRKK